MALSWTDEDDDDVVLLNDIIELNKKCETDEDRRLSSTASLISIFSETGASSFVVFNSAMFMRTFASLMVPPLLPVLVQTHRSRPAFLACSVVMCCLVYPLIVAQMAVAFSQGLVNANNSASSGILVIELVSPIATYVLAAVSASCYVATHDIFEEFQSMLFDEHDIGLVGSAERMETLKNALQLPEQAVTVRMAGGGHHGHSMIDRTKFSLTKLFTAQAALLALPHALCHTLFRLANGSNGWGGTSGSHVFVSLSCIFTSFFPCLWFLYFMIEAIAVYKYRCLVLQNFTALTIKNPKGILSKHPLVLEYFPDMSRWKMSPKQLMFWFKLRVSLQLVTPRLLFALQIVCGLGLAILAVFVVGILIELVLAARRWAFVTLAVVDMIIIFFNIHYVFVYGIKMRKLQDTHPSILRSYDFVRSQQQVLESLDDRENKNNKTNNSNHQNNQNNGVDSKDQVATSSFSEASASALFADSVGSSRGFDDTELARRMIEYVAATSVTPSLLGFELTINSYYTVAVSLGSTMAVAATNLGVTL